MCMCVLAAHMRPTIWSFLAYVRISSNLNFMAYTTHYTHLQKHEIQLLKDFMHTILRILCND